jgi:glucosamine-6-phosphate deaminase
MKVDHLIIHQYKTRLDMGQSAGKRVAEKIKALQDIQESIHIIFASAPSQNEFLWTLRNEDGIQWEKVHAFHMDEYVGLPDNAPQNFGNFLKVNLFDHVPVGKVSYIHGNATSVEEECERYTKLLLTHPTDIICMGIGENGHIAFNDPHVADFNDPMYVKKVSLDDASRQQQVHDGCFTHFEAVPTHALTLTIPALVSAKYVFCIVPGINKAPAIFNTLRQKIDEAFPSTILRKHPDAQLFIDEDSGSLLDLSLSVSSESRISENG